MHSDPAYAAATPFKAPIAPGIFTAGLISAVIGTELPGPGAIYLSQSLKFVKPVKAGDVITARAEIVEMLAERNRVRLQTVCVNQRGEEVLSGEAWIMPSRTRVVYEGRAEPEPAWSCAGLEPVDVDRAGHDLLGDAVAVDAVGRAAAPGVAPPQSRSATPYTSTAWARPLTNSSPSRTQSNVSLTCS